MKNTIVCDNIDMSLTELERMFELIRIINSNPDASLNNDMDELLGIIGNSGLHNLSDIDS